MRKLHLRLYLTIVVVLVLFTITVAMIWHGANIGSRLMLHGVHAVLMLGTVAAAIALLAYPLARGLTARLGRLNEGVRKFGAGDLGARVMVEGKDEVAALATSFNDSAARIEQLVHANRMLLANCSHELRTPLTRMRLAVEKLGGTEESARIELTRNIGELDALIGELLLTSRLDAAQRPDRVELIDLLALVAEEAAYYDREVTGMAVIARGDRLLLRRLTRNLLENARVHAGGASSVRVEREDGVARIVIEDAGPGVPANVRQQIFDPFYRSPGSERTAGAGLGLSIVRQIARVHGGDATCESPTGGGSRFVVTLPARPDDEA